MGRVRRVPVALGVSGLLVACRPGAYCDPLSRSYCGRRPSRDASVIISATDVASGGVAAGRACACEMPLARKPAPPGAQRPPGGALSGSREQEVGKLQANVGRFPFFGAAPHSRSLARDGANFPCYPVGYHARSTGYAPTDVAMCTGLGRRYAGGALFYARLYI